MNPDVRPPVMSGLLKCFTVRGWNALSDRILDLRCFHGDELLFKISFLKASLMLLILATHSWCVKCKVKPRIHLRSRGLQKVCWGLMNCGFGQAPELADFAGMLLLSLEVHVQNFWIQPWNLPQWGKGWGEVIKGLVMHCWNMPDDSNFGRYPHVVRQMRPHSFSWMKECILDRNHSKECKYSL